MTHHEFPTPHAASLYVEIGRGDVRIHLSDTTTTTVEVTGRDAERVEVSERDGEISVVAPNRGLLSGFDAALHVRVDLPVGSAITTRTGSADVTIGGGAAGVTHVKTGSGEVRVEEIDGGGSLQSGSGDLDVRVARGALKVKTGSGQVRVGEVVTDLRVSTGSGDVRVGTGTGPVAVKSGSGDLRIERAAADLSFTTGSGGLRVDTATRGRITSKGASGGVRVAVPAGVPVWTDISTVSGRIHSTLTGAGAPAEGQDHVELHAVTVSGDVDLVEV